MFFDRHGLACGTFNKIEADWQVALSLKNAHHNFHSFRREAGQERERACKAKDNKDLVQCDAASS